MNIERPSHAEPPLYFSYLIRLWQEELEGEWRASAHSVQSKVTVHFRTPEDLFAFLEKETVWRSTQNDENNQVDTESPPNRPQIGGSSVERSTK